MILFFAPFSFYLCYLFFQNKANNLKAIILYSFFSINILLNTIWYFNDTYTLRDASRKIKSITKKELYFAGYNTHWLAIETDIKPVWYMGKNGLNNWFLDYIVNGEFYLFSKTKEYDYVMDSIDIDRLDSNKLRKLLTIKLSPLPFTGEYRDEGILYKVN